MKTNTPKTKKEVEAMRKKIEAILNEPIVRTKYGKCPHCSFKTKSYITHKNNSIAQHIRSNHPEVPDKIDKILALLNPVEKEPEFIKLKKKDLKGKFDYKLKNAGLPIPPCCDCIVGERSKDGCYCSCHFFEASAPSPKKAPRIWGLMAKGEKRLKATELALDEAPKGEVCPNCGNSRTIDRWAKGKGSAIVNGEICPVCGKPPSPDKEWWEKKWGILLMDIFLKSKPKAQKFPIGQLEKRGIDFIHQLLKAKDQEADRRMSEAYNEILRIMPKPSKGKFTADSLNVAYEHGQYTYDFELRKSIREKIKKLSSK